MSFFYRFIAIFRLTFKRLWAQRGLTFATLLGLATAVAFITTVPLYADAVQFRILQERLTANAERINTPPFAYIYRYIGGWEGPIERADLIPLNEYLINQGARDLGLPQEFIMRHFETDSFRLYPGDATSYGNPDAALGYTYFATTSNIIDHITLLEGSFPSVADSAPDGIVPVMVTEQFALELGLQVGDNLIAYDANAESDDSQRQIPVQISGIWQPNDVTDPFWPYSPDMFVDLLIVPEETFNGRLGHIKNEVNLAMWYLSLDGEQVGTNDVSTVTSRANRVARRVDELLPGTRNDTTPVDGLSNYRRAVSELTQLLAAYSVPLVGLILAFTGLIVGLAVNQRRNEIAVMRSRGATVWQMVGLSALEGIILGLIAFGLGMIAGLALTQLIGKARSFLDFSAVSTLRLAVTSTAVRAGVMAVGLAILAQVIPTISAARDTVITYKQDQARAAKNPWWQRAGLDFMLLGLSAYGIYQLRQQSSIFTADGDVLQNPLLLLLPSLVTLAATLFCLRLLPLLMEAISWLLAQSNSVGLLLASRHLARTPSHYATPLILIALTVSLAIFTASLAQTMDYQLFDELRYETGGDVNLVGAGRAFSTSGGYGPPPDTTTQRVLFLPMTEYLEMPGVESASRVGRYLGSAEVGGQRISGTYLGVDRDSFNDASFWRYDFAPIDLGYLMNNLAATPDGLLVPQAFLDQTGLQIGDFFRLSVRNGEDVVPILGQIAGSFNYFPTWYPEDDGMLFVGNLDTLFAQIGGELPYEVWMRTAPDFDEELFDAALNERNLYGWYWTEPYARIQAEQLKPARQGVFGLLSVGFVASALLTVLGFFLYALFSFRRRFIELGVLRAVGLSMGQMVILVGGELALLISLGLGLGTSLGAWVSQLFIPALQSGEGANRIPPYLVEIAWNAISQVYVLFGVMFLLALIALAISLRRMRVFQAIKLGETV